MRLALAILVLLLCPLAHAGFAGGPFLAFYNLSSTQPEITETIRKYIHGLPGTEFCGDTALGWIVYTHEYPISTEEIRAAFTKRSTSTLSIVAIKLRKFKAKDIENGLDGVIVFTDTGGGYFASIDTRGKYVRSENLHNSNDPDKIIEAFCSVNPTVYRK